MSQNHFDDELPADDFVTAPPGQQKKLTAKDRARAAFKHPRNRFGLFMLGAMGVAGYLALAGNAQENVASAGPSAMKDVPKLNSEAGGNIQNTSPEISRALKENDKERAEQALKTGDSFIPNMSTGKVEAAGPVSNAALDFERPKAPEPRSPEPRPVRETPAQPTPAEIAVRQAQTEAANREAAARQAAMTQQLSQITGTFVPPAPATVMYAQPNLRPAEPQVQQVAQQQTPGAQQAAPAGPPIAKAGSIWYGRVETSTSSVKPGPVLVRIVSGPLAGAKLLGQGSKADDAMVVRFDKLALPDQLGGRTVAIDALAIDPNTSEATVASEVYRGYFERYGLGLAAAFIQGYGEAVSQGGTTVVTGTGQVVQIQDPLSPREKIFSALGDVGQAVGNEMNAIAQSGRYPIVYLNNGEPVGILLMSDLADPRFSR